MNENISFSVIFSFILLFVVVVTGCRTTTNVDDTILDYQRKVVELEATVASLNARVARATEQLRANNSRLGDLAARSGDITGSIDEIIIIFGEYEQEVRRVVDELDAISSAAADTN